MDIIKEVFKHAPIATTFIGLSALMLGVAVLPTVVAAAEPGILIWAAMFCACAHVSGHYEVPS
ncbi:hypothetical protein CPT_Slocum_066 [Serratia phage Slocum]|nr:hypothetical protein CPT_Slocum_066 [Serratia phage Slocum]